MCFDKTWLIGFGGSSSQYSEAEGLGIRRTAIENDAKRLGPKCNIRNVFFFCLKPKGVGVTNDFFSFLLSNQKGNLLMRVKSWSLVEKEKKQRKTGEK